MQEEKKTGKIFDRKTLLGLYKFVNPYKWRFYFLVLLTLLLAGLGPSRPYFVQYTIDHYVLKSDKSGLSFMVSLLIGLLFFQAIIEYAHTYISGWLGQTVVKDIRVKLFKHISNFKLSYFDNTPVGRLITRCVSDIETLSDVFSQGFASISGDLLQIAVILGLMLWTDWKLTLISMSFFPLLIWATYIFKEKIKNSFNEVRLAVAKLNTFVQEHISGMSVVQSFNREESEFKKFERINEEHKQSNLKSVLYYSIYFPVAEVLAAMATGMLVWYGANGVLVGKITEGTLVAFIMYLAMFFRPIRQIADRFNTLQLGIVSADRILKLLDDDKNIAQSGKIITQEIQGNISFQNVSFAYKEGNSILKNVSFEVKAGSTLALVGATGAGKTSVINLLNRFYDYQSGKILIDNTEITHFELEFLRNQIGLVLQDVFLFSGSIFENISLGDPNISRGKVEQIAEMLGASSFIENLPGKYDYQVMERGATLSVGQRQLISFIRVMAFEPKILILDEATSSIDTNTENLIQYALDKIMHQRTCIIVAHRLSTIKKANHILVFDKGEIVEQGTHEFLLENQGYYARLQQAQEILTHA